VIGSQVLSVDTKSKVFGVSPSLGTYAQIPSTTATDTAALISAKPTPAENRNLRYAMLKKAAQLYSVPTYKKKNGRDGFERISRCSRWVVRDARYVTIRSNGDRAAFHNVERCNSPMCPVCGIVRAAQNRLELTAAIAAAARMGYTPMLITYTARHDARTPLKDFKKRQSAAHTKVWEGREGQNIKEEFGVVGFIRVKEMTYGKNGHHPHLHALTFIDMGTGSEVSPEMWAALLNAVLTPRWLKMLKKQGLQASDERGVDVRAGDSYIAEYVSKFGHEPTDYVWGIADEVAGAHAKKSAAGGLTPLQLLAAAAGVNPEALISLRDIVPTLKRKSDKTVKDFAAARWMEVYDAYKGDHLLRWSPGLKKLLNVEAELAALAADLEAAETELTDRVLIHVDEWQRIIPPGNAHFSQPDYRAEMLQAVMMGESSARDWFALHCIQVVILSQTVNRDGPPMPPYAPLYPTLVH